MCYFDMQSLRGAHCGIPAPTHVVETTVRLRLRHILHICRAMGFVPWSPGWAVYPHVCHRPRVDAHLAVEESPELLLHPSEDPPARDALLVLRSASRALTRAGCAPSAHRRWLLAHLVWLKKVYARSNYHSTWSICISVVRARFELGVIFIIYT